MWVPGVFKPGGEPAKNIESTGLNGESGLKDHACPPDLQGPVITGRDPGFQHPETEKKNTPSGTRDGKTGTRNQG
jgi:hypothetical protein